ncbi:MAG: hypothetical protein EHM28_05395 [Spirochaetaceae bacterium]|nr:MAG: hypothetical protein EHM28_05395 [Spirochaetaceae bacterium]
MKRNILQHAPAAVLVFTILFFSGCGTVKIELGHPRTGSSSPATDSNKPPQSRSNDLTIESIAAIGKRHAQGTGVGSKVLAAGDTMVFSKQVIVGGCWDFVNAVYIKAGFPADKREKIYMEKETGPFADPAMLQPGDWVMYRNLPYEEIGHSAIFVEWIDFSRRSALTIEYVGRSREMPGWYREADLTKIWGILRPRG